MNEKQRFWYVHDHRGFFAWLMLSVDWFLSLSYCMSVLFPLWEERRHSSRWDYDSSQMIHSYLQNAMFLVFNIKLILFPFAFVLNHQMPESKTRNDPRLKAVIFSNRQDDGVSHFYSYCFCSSSVVPGVWIGRFKPGMLSAVLITFRYQTYCWTSYCAFFVCIYKVRFGISLVT